MNGGGLLSSLLSSSASRPIWKCIMSNATIKSYYATSATFRYVIATIIDVILTAGFAQNSGFDAGKRVNSLFTAFSLRNRGSSIDRFALISYFICKLRRHIHPTAMCWRNARKRVDCFWLAPANGRQIFASSGFVQRHCNSRYHIDTRGLLLVMLEPWQDTTRIKIHMDLFDHVASDAA